MTAWAIDPSSAEDGWTVSGRGYAKIRLVDQDAHVDVPIGNGGVIRGKIIIEGSRVMSATGSVVWLRGSGGVAKSDQSGAFTIQDVPPGLYTFQFPTLERSAYQKRVLCSGTDYTVKPLELDVGTVTDCEITLSTDTAAILGRVLEDGKPMSGMVVVSIPKSVELRHVERYTRTVQTGNDGQFQLPATIPGEYLLYAVPESSDHSYFALDFADRNRSYAQQVSVKPGETQVVNMEPSASK